MKLVFVLIVLFVLFLSIFLIIKNNEDKNIIKNDINLTPIYNQTINNINVIIDDYIIPLNSSFINQSNNLT